MKSFTKILMSLALAVGITTSAFGDILTEQPYYWYQFDSGYNQCGSKSLGGASTKRDSNNNEVSPWGYAMKLTKSTGSGPYGDSFALGTGNWTYHVRAKLPANLADGVIWNIGSCNAANGLLLLTRANDAGLRIVRTSAARVLDDDTDVLIDKTGLSTDYHDITAVYTSSSKSIQIYIDGAKAGGVFTSPTAFSGNKAWQWLAPYSGGSVAKQGYGVCIEEVRFYQKALSASEISTLHNGACIGKVTLEEDTDWSSGVPSGKVRAAIDLNGHKLTLPNVSMSEVYNVQNSATGDAAQLYVNVASGKTSTMYSWLLYGNLALVKKGAGTVTLSGYDKLNMACTIDEGTLKLGYVGFADAQTVTIGESGTLDTNGTYDQRYGVVMKEGATLTNTGTSRDYGKTQLSNGITLDENATVYVSPKNEMSSTALSYGVYSINLNGGTIVKNNTGKWGVVNVNFTNGGKVVVEKGEFNIGRKDNKTETGGFACNDNFVIELKKDSTSYIWMQGECTVPTIIGEGNIASSSHKLIVTSRFSGLIELGKSNGDNPFTASNKLTLGDGATLDLNGNTAPFAMHDNFAFGANCVIDVSGRDLAIGTQLVAWNASGKPSTTFVWDETTEAKGVTLVANDKGIYYGQVVVKAEWTNLLGDDDITNPENWTCYDEEELIIDGAVPSAVSNITIPDDMEITYPAGNREGSFTLGMGAKLTIDFGEGKYIEGTALLTSSAGTLDLANGTVVVPGGTYELTPDAKQLRYLPPKVMVARWDFDNYNPETPKSPDVLAATKGEAGIPCYKEGKGSEEIEDLGEMSVTNVIGEAGNYAIVIPKYSHVKLPLPKTVQRGDWTIRMRFFTPEASDGKFRTFFTRDNTEDGDLFINTSNLVGGGGKIVPSQKYYGSPVAKEQWHLLTVSQRNGYGAVCVDGEQSYTWTDGSKWNYFFDKDYLYLCADENGDDELLFVDYIELDVDRGVWTGVAEDNDIANAENWQDGYVPYANGTFTADVDLAADADWTAAGTITFDNKIIALNGQAITLSVLDGTGKVKIDADTVGTLKGGAFKASIANNGTLNFDGGTAETPILVTNDANLGKVTLAEDTYVKFDDEGTTRLYDVTGSGASSVFMVARNTAGNAGITKGSSFANLMFESIATGTGDKSLWLEHSTIAETVGLKLTGAIKLSDLTPNPVVLRGLSGAAELTNYSGKPSGVIIRSLEDNTYAGKCSLPITIDAGTGTQTLSGNYTGALTVNAGGKVKLAGNANPSSVSGAGTVIVAKDTIPANISNFTGTFVVDASVETLNLGTTRPTATFTFEGETTVRYTEIIADDGILHNLTLSGGTMPTYKVYDADGNEKAITAGKYTPTVSGKAAIKAYEFNGDLSNSGNDGSGSMGKDNGPFYKDDVEVYALTQPYKDLTWPTEFTVAIHSTLPDLQNACLVACGTLDGGGIGLTTGDPTRNEVKMVYWPKNTAYTTLATMTVPNAQTSKHLYVFTKTADTLKIYLDGSLVVDYSGTYSLGGGLQVGSVHGGIGNTGLGRLDVVYGSKTDIEKCYSVINSMRIYDTVIGPNAMAELVREFPYESPNGTFARTLTGTENTWVAEDAWTKQGEPFDAPEKGATVNLAASEAATVTLNLEEAVSYEAMNLSGEGTITIAAPAANANKISCSSTAKFGANAVVQYSAMSLAGTPIEITAGKKLTIDASMIDLTQYFESTDITLTGLVTANDPATQLACTLPEATEHRTVQFVKNESNHTYELKITVDATVPFVYTIAEGEETGTWTWGEQVVDEATVLAQSSATIKKAGTGTQSFLGKNKYTYVVDGGILKFTNNVNMVTSTITVNAGGAFDMDGNETGSHYNIVLNGGTLANYGEGIAYNKRAIKSITLTDDSFVTTSGGNICFVSDAYKANTLDLGGHTLTKNGSKIFILMNTTVTNGAVVVEEGEIRVNAPSGTVNDTVFTDDTTLELKKGAGLYVNLSSLVLPEITGEGKVKVDTTLVVSNKLEGALAVSGSGTLTLAEGAVLDLAMLEGAYTWPTQIACDETQTINLNGRTLKLGDKIIAWTAIPEGITFQWDEETAKAGVEPKYEADGLLYGYDPESKIVDKGYWTGAVDGDGKNPANWGCTNKAGYVVADALPTNAEATVILNGPLAGDCDWTGLGAFVLAQDTLVDLNGHNFAIADFANATTGIVVTNSVETTGDFVIDVAAEKTAQNTTVKIAGNVRLVKEGAGTFESKVQSQSYMGGTLISGGTIKATDYEKNHLLGAAGTDITVEPNGTLDLNGWYDWDSSHRIVLAGGTLQNAGGNMTQTSWGGIGDVILTADSKMKLKYHTLFNDNNTTRYVDLGGYTLTADFIENSDPKAIVYVRNNTFKNGTLVMNKGIVLRPLTTTGVSGADFTLVVNGDIAPTASNYTIESVVDNSEGRITDGTYVGTITKCYKPVSTNFQNFVIADGATLDLTAQTETWSTASALAGKSVTFAANATNTVDLTGRTIKDGDKIIAWTTQPADTTTFEFRGYEGDLEPVAEEDGLYARLALVQFTIADVENATKMVEGATQVEGNTYTAKPGADVTVTYTAKPGYHFGEGEPTVVVEAKAAKDITITTEAETEKYPVKIGDVYYLTLNEAVKAYNGTEDIVLLADLTGAAVGTYKTPAAGQIGVKDIVIDFGGFTYTVEEPMSGSPGYETQAFHFEGGNVVLKNGTITSTAAKMLIQNYTDLTLTDLVIDGSGLVASNSQYVFSNNSGTVNLTGTTKVIGKDGWFTMDTCQYGSYTIPTVTIDGATIEGPIELSGGNLTLASGDFSKASLSVYGAELKGTVTKDPSVELAAPAGYAWGADGVLAKIPAATIMTIAAVKNLDSAYNCKLTSDYVPGFDSWKANFVVTFDKDVKAGSLGLAGQYDEYSEDWVPMALTKDLAAGEEWYLMPEGEVSYRQIAAMKNGFNCGVKNVSQANKDTVMTVKIVLNDGTTDYTIATQDYTLAFNPPKATVTQMSPIPEALDDAYTFAVAEDEKGQGSVSPFKDWNCDFVVSFDKAINANTVTLAGQFDAFSSEWTKMPLPAIPANYEIKLVEQLKTTITYETLCNVVQVFNCGVANTSAENEGTKMTVKLVMTKGDETQTIVTQEATLTKKCAKIGDVYYLTLADAAAAAKDGDTVTLLADATADGISCAAKVTFDINGKTLTVAQGFTTTTDLTLVNSVAGQGGFVVGGTVSVNGGTLDASGLAVAQGGVIPGQAGGIAVANGATFAMMNEWAAYSPNWLAANRAGFLTAADGGMVKMGSTVYTAKDGLFGTANTVAKAKITAYGVTYTETFDTLAAAIAAANAGTTVTLLADVTTAEKDPFTINKNITLDFATFTVEKTVANDYTFDIPNGATVVFKGTTGGVKQTQTAKNLNNPASMIRNKGDLTIAGGVYTSDFCVIKNDEDPGAGTLTVNGGTFNIVQTQGGYTGFQSSLMNWATATINGGTWNGGAINTRSCDANKDSKAGTTEITATLEGTATYVLSVGYEGDTTYANVPKMKGVALANVELRKVATITDELELVEKDGYVTVQVAGPKPAPGSEAEVTPVAEDTYYVEPTGTSKTVVIENVKETDTIIVDATLVDAIGGVDVDQVEIVATAEMTGKADPVDISDAFKAVEDGNKVAIVLDGEASVTIDSEVIPVTPTTTESTEGTIAEGAVATKAIPGLTYTLKRGTEIGTYGDSVASAQATSTTISLKDETTKPTDKAFYVIEVTK